MAISKNKRDKTFYISYSYALGNGKYKRYNIYNKEWTYSVGIKYMRSIEQKEIEKDLIKRKLEYHTENATFREVVDMFLANKENKFKTNTAYNYKLIAYKYFDKFIADNKEFAVVAEQHNIIKWCDYINNLDDIGVKRKNRVKMCMKDLLKFAYERDYISMELYKKSDMVIEKGKENKEVKEKLNFWTDEEFDRFIRTFKEDDKWRLCFMVCYWGALRVGELLGLKWEDVKFNNNTISINKELTASGKIETTKTASSNNVVSLPSALMKELEEFKKDCDAKDTDFVFFIKHVGRTTMRRVMDQHIKLAGVKKITIHGLRHSMASYMINKDIDIMIISRHLRHSSTQQTYDTYCHLFPSRNQNVMDSLFK